MDFFRLFLIFYLRKSIDIPDDRRRRARLYRLISQIARCALSTISIAFPERRMWTAIRSSFWFDNIVLQHFDDKEFKENFRINRVTYFSICDKLRPYLEKKKVVREVISVERRVAVTLAKLGSSGELRNLANLFGMARSTVCVVVKETTHAIVCQYKTKIKFPEGDALDLVTSSFLGMCGLPGVCGALDGTHIPIKAPSSNKRDYFNRKQFYSLVLQAVVDHKKKFVNLNLGWPGSVHDARVLVNSELFGLCESGHLGNIFCELPGTGSTINPYLVADPAYPLKKWLMKPFSGALSRQQALFNKKLSRCRIFVEHSFGMLKGRWRCLLKPNDCALKRLEDVVIACCILHNIAQDVQDEYLYRWDEEDGLHCNDPLIFPVLQSNDSKAFRKSLMDWCANNPS